MRGSETTREGSATGVAAVPGEAVAVAPVAAGAGAAAAVTRPGPARLLAVTGLLAAIGLVFPVVAARAYGAMGIVRNDDWSYLLTLFRWVDHGRLDFNNWVSMTLLTQLVLAAPIVQLFGHAITLIQFQTALFGLAGLLAVLWFSFTVTRKLWLATFVAALVAVGPLWGALAVSFMTDVPAFAVSMLSIALGVRALRSRGEVSLPFLVASMATGLVAFTIRQYAAVPLVAVALVGGWLLWQEPSRRRFRVFVAATLVLVAAAAAFLAYWSTIPHPKAFAPVMPNGHSVRATLYKGTGLVRLLGLLVAPALAAAGPVRILRRSWRVARDTTVFAGAGTIAVLAFTASAGPNIGFAGNYITPRGILAQGVISGPRPEILPAGVFPFLLAAGTLSATLLAIALVPLLHGLATRWRARHDEPVDGVVVFLGLVVAGYGLAYFTAAITDIPMYDRYILPVVPVVALLVLGAKPPADAVPENAVSAARRSRARLGFAGGAFAALAFVGAVYTVDSASFDGTRWKVAVAATREGWTRRQIRGGFEWTNFYHGTRFSRAAPACVTVALDPPGGVRGDRVVAFDYYRSPFIEPVPVVAQRTRVPCVPARRPR
jgi:hypothetical protein